MQLSKLKVNPKNPQIFGDLSKLQKSIEEFPKMMVLRPMVYDPSSMEVLGGNKRLICLQDMGFKEIPDTWIVSAANLTKEEKKRFILADNIQFGEWDFEMPETEFSDIDVEELGLEVDMSYADDEALRDKSSDRGGFMSDGLKFQFGNVTQYMTDKDEFFEDAMAFEELLLSKSETEINEIICKLLSEYISSVNS